MSGARCLCRGALGSTVKPEREDAVDESVRRTIDEVLARAREHLVRLSPTAAHEAQRGGATIIDIRSEADRTAEGTIPGAVVVERTVLEWRLDPACEARLPIASYDLFPIMVCNEGYSSSLAAAALQELGVLRATDVDGGFRAWRAAGLPTEP
jgi:rhodanese-related sulfurtransferase